MSRRQALSSSRLISYLVLSIFAIFTLFPVLQIISVSLRPAATLHSTRLVLLPDDWTFDAYRKLFCETDFLLWLRNSAFVALTVALTSILLASPAGYALARFPLRGKRFALLFLISTQMFPVTMLLLPLFLIIVKLQLYDTYIGLSAIYAATALPFCIWQMKGYYDTLPASLEEAALLDGCGPWAAFFRVVFPLALPALTVTALFSFISAWSEYLVAAVMLSDTALFTLPLGLKAFHSNFDTEWNLYAAASLVVSLPVVALFLLLSRFLISGLTLGGVKG